MRIYDISLPIERSLAIWPGDAPYALIRTCAMRDGDVVNLSELRVSVHMGTHVDAPWHIDPGGQTVDAVALEPYVGPAVVIDVTGLEIIRPRDIPADRLALAPRILLRTGAWADATRFPDRIPVLDESVPDYLADNGAILLGVDVPSVDALDSADLPIHRDLNARNVRILEGLRLDDAPDGVYELFALPLKLVGSDGSPVRAILRG